MILTTFLPKGAPPIQPGEVLLEEFLNPMGMTQTKLAELTGLGTRAINEIIKGKRAVTPRTAILLSDVFGNSVEQWLNIQRNVDLWNTLKAMGRLDATLLKQPSRLTKKTPAKKIVGAVKAKKASPQKSASKKITPKETRKSA